MPYPVYPGSGEGVRTCEMLEMSMYMSVQLLPVSNRVRVFSSASCQESHREKKAPEGEGEASRYTHKASDIDNTETSCAKAKQNTKDTFVHLSFLPSFIQFINSFTHSLRHTRSLTHSLTHSLTLSLSLSLSHSLTHSLIK